MFDLAAAAAEARRVFAIPEAERALLARIGETLMVPCDHVLFQAGVHGDDFFLVLAGELEMLQDGRRSGLLTTGGIVGEMGLFNAKQRVFTVRALSECKLVRVAAAGFLRHVNEGDPAAMAIMERLGALMIRRVQAAERSHALAPGREPEAAAEVRQRMVKAWALRYHAMGRPGKLTVEPARSLTSAAELAVAYTPGVIAPCIAIHDAPLTSWAYTARGRLVGVISNGTDILCQGALGPDSVKPLLEGKVVLLKRFAGLDGFDLELAELDPTRVVELICALEPTFGAITLEHFAPPASLAIVDACTRRMQIPVVQDDQHCMGVVAVAALVNGLHLAGKALCDARIVISGDGPMAVGTGLLLRAMGVKSDRLVVVDKLGPLHAERSLRSWFFDLVASPCPASRAEALAGADAYVGCGTAAALTPAELRTMASQPVLVSLGLPRPEMTWPEAMRTRNDVLMTTSTGTHGNHATTLLVFPHLLRALLDCRARNLPMAALVAAADSLAALARAGGVDGEGMTRSFDAQHLLPNVIDPRLPQMLPVAIADAIMAEGAAGLHVDLAAYHARQQDFRLTLS